MRLECCVCVVLLLGQSALCNAGDDIVQLEPFPVGSSRLATGFQQAPEASHLFAEAIQQLQPTSLWDSLETLPGLYIEQPGGLAGNSSLYLRGGDPNFVKVLVDGIEVNDLNSSRGGTYNFSAIAPRAVRQLSLLPGAQSAIYGSDALSGVVLVETLDPDRQPRQALAVEAGTGGYHSLDARGSALTGSLYVQAGINKAREDEAVEGSSFDAVRGNVGASWRSGRNGLQVDISTFAAEVERSHYPDDSGGPVHAASRTLDHVQTKEWGSSLQVRSGLRSDISFQGYATYYTLETDSASPGVAPGLRDPAGVPANTFQSGLDRWSLGGHLRHQLSDAMSLVYGAEAVVERGSSESIVSFPFGPLEGRYDRDVRTGSLFTELGWELADGHWLHGALRYDDVEHLDSKLTSRASYALSLDRIRSHLQLTYGEGFKKPSFFATGNPMVGNPDLQPEESVLYEISLATRLPGNRATLTNTIFRQKFTNLVDLSEAAPPRMINLSEVISEGATTELHLRVNDWVSFRGSISYLDVTVVDSDELLRNRPKWRTVAMLDLRPVSSLSATLIGTSVSRRQDSSIPTGQVELQSHTVVDAVLRWHINENLHLSAGVEDIFNAAVEETVGFYAPGRRYKLSAVATW